MKTGSDNQNRTDAGGFRKMSRIIFSSSTAAVRACVAQCTLLGRDNKRSTSPNQQNSKTSKRLLAINDTLNYLDSLFICLKGSSE